MIRMQKRGLKTPSTNSTSGSTKQRLEPRPALERSLASLQIGSRYKKKKDLNIYNSGQYGIGPGSCVLFIVFLPLFLPPSQHHLLQALPLSFLLQVNFTNNLISQISCAGCPAPLSSLVDQEATAAREDSHLLKT